MKKFLQKLLLFLLCSFLFYILFIGVWGYFIPSSLRRNLMFNPNEGFLETKLIEVEKYKDLDVVFFGSSHSYRGFDTRIFRENGISSFNLGSSAQTHIQTKYLMERYLKDLNPKLLIYEVYPEMFAIKGVESTINIISATEDININSLELLLKTKDIRALNTLLFSLYDASNIEEIDHKYAQENHYVSGGFVERKLSYNSQTAVTREWHPLPKQIDAFKENIQFLKSHNIPYLLVQAPYTFSYNNQQEVEDFIIKYGNYYNFNELTSLSSQKDFFDESHLNQNGVNKFNRELIKLIDSLRLLEN